MKARLLFALSLLVNLFLLLVLLGGGTKQHESSGGRETPDVPPSTVTAHATNLITLEGQRVPILFHWSLVESRDYRFYIANLRAIGCPEETIRDIIIAEINRLYWPKLAVLTAEASNFWDCSRSPDAGPLALERKRREIENEKREFIKTLLGIDPTPELLQVAGKIDYTSDGISQLADGKRDKAREIIENYSVLEMEVLRQSRGIITDEDRAEMKRIQRGRREELAQILTPQELEDYELRKSETAGRMRGNLIGFEPTEEEFRGIFRLQRAFDEDFDPSTFLDPDDKAGQQRRSTAEEQLKAELRKALGEERYKDYERSQDSGYRWLVQIAERFGQPRDIATEVLSLKESIHEQARRINSDATMSAEDRKTSLQNLQGWAEGTIQASLGLDAYNFYKKRGGQWMTQLLR